MERHIARKANAALLLILTASAVSAQTPPASLAPLSARLQNERDNLELQKIRTVQGLRQSLLRRRRLGRELAPDHERWLILIDTLEPRYVDHLLDSVTKLGFSPTNIKHVIVLQAHFDHLGGAALLQEKYGAKVWARRR